MKTTVRTTSGRIMAEPLDDGRVQVTIDAYGLWAVVELDQDQVGALLFGIEQAAEAAQIAADRAKA